MLRRVFVEGILAAGSLADARGFEAVGEKKVQAISVPHSSLQKSMTKADALHCCQRKFANLLSTRGGSQAPRTGLEGQRRHSLSSPASTCRRHMAQATPAALL